MLQSEYDVIVRHQRLKVLLIILTGIAVALVLYATIKVGREYFSTGNNSIPVKTDTITVSSPEPVKTDFGTAFPKDFPSDIPVEKDVKFTQSYILDYPGQKQLSIVFPSTKTVKENYALYKDYLEKQGWNILNKGEDTKASFLYVTKDAMDMNVTISEGVERGMVNLEGATPPNPDPSAKKELLPEHSQVSISVLKK